MNQNRFRAFLQQGNNAAWCIFVLFASVLLIKCIYFDWSMRHSILISSLWKRPLIFWIYWLPKIIISIFLASFIFISKRHRWTIVTSVIIDLWIIANMIYFRANSLFINLDSIMMVGNMDGFWNSLTLYINCQMFLYPILTLFYGVVLYFLPTTNRRNIITYFVIITTTVFLWLCYGLLQCISHKTDITSKYKYFIPFQEPNVPKHEWYKDNVYIQNHSIISHIPYVIIDGITTQMHRYKNKDVQFTEKEHLFLGDIIKNEEQKTLLPQCNLIIFLVESLESWVLDIPNITPNFKYVLNSGHVFYSDKIISQVKYGTSGDGQMILNTGLLPIQSGAACMIYGNNTYPNFAHLYPYSRILNPANGVWNQPAMTKAYDYTEMIEPHNGDRVGWWQDEQIFQIVIDSVFDNVNNHNTPFLELVITYSTHSPFKMVGRDYPELTLPEDIPEMMRDYLTSVHYTDSCFGAFWDKFIESEYARNTTVVITGDHTIFKEAMLREFTPFATKHNLPIKDGQNYCPLIIYSPFIEENITIREECYQMDIYPTILSLIGAEDYYWKGLGVNLLDSTVRSNRAFSESEAYILSDKLIRSNWFYYRYQ